MAIVGFLLCREPLGSQAVMEAVHRRGAGHDKKGDGDPTPIVVPVVLRAPSIGSGASNGSRISRSTSNFGRTRHPRSRQFARQSAPAAPQQARPRARRWDWSGTAAGSDLWSALGGPGRPQKRSY